MLYTPRAIVIYNEYSLNCLIINVVASMMIDEIEQKIINILPTSNTMFDEN